MPRNSVGNLRQRLLHVHPHPDPRSPPAAVPKPHKRRCFNRRSASEPVDGDDDADEIPPPAYDSSGNAVSAGGAGDPSAAFRSTPGADAMLAAPTPGRETEGERTWVMARRVASNWEEEQMEEEKRRANGGAGAGGPVSGVGGSGTGMSPEGEKPSPETPRT